jgi:hypothetical protein
MENSKTFLNQDSASPTSQVLVIIGLVVTTNTVHNTKKKLRRKLGRQSKSAILFKGFSSSTLWAVVREVGLALTF